MKTDLILFPSSILHTKQVDENLQNEYDAVKITGLFDIALFDYMKWFDEETLSLNNASSELRSAVYRGWMMKPDKYEKFYALLLNMNIRLVTSPDEYRLMHVFPDIYEYVREDTAKILVFSQHEHIDVERLKTEFTRFMVKDFVKSVKGTDFPRWFDTSITQDDFDRWMEVFYKYRGDLLTGGICIKEYLDLKKYGHKTNEFRVFYINHEIATVCRNSGQGNYTPEPPWDLLEKHKKLGSPYYTVDYAELLDGTWIIIEAGDGSVSGLSDGQDYEQYFRAVYHCFN